MADEANGVNIPINSEADLSGFDAIAAAGVQMGARLRELQTEEAKASVPVAPPVSAPGAPAAEQALRKVGDAGEDAAKRTNAGLSETDKFLHTLQEGAGGLAGAFKAGLGIGAAESVLSTLESVKERLQECLAEGVEVNKEFETLGVGLASSLRQADPERFGDFNKALEASGELIDTIRAKALELNLDAGELGHNVQVNMLSLVEGGIHDLNAQVETTGLLMQAAAAKGITGFQAVRDVIDILNGKAERVILSKELGITNEDISRAKQAGDLAGYLAEKLGAYREAAAATRDTLAGLQQQESTLGKNLEGQLSAGLFRDAKEQAQGMVQALNSPEVHEAAEVFSQILGDVGEIKVAAGDVLRIVSLLAVGAAAVADPLAVITAHIQASTAESDKLGKSIVTGTKALQDQVQQADTLEKKAAARASVEDALAAAQAKADSQRRAGNEGNAELLDQQAVILRRMLDTFDQTAGRVVSIGTHEENRRATMERQQELLDAQLASVDKLDKALAAQANKTTGLSPEDLRAKINAQLANAKTIISDALKLPDDFQFVSADQIAKFRDQLNPSLPNYNELRGKLSDVALDVLRLGDAYDTASKKAEAAAEKQKREADALAEKEARAAEAREKAIQQDRDSLATIARQLDDQRAKVEDIAQKRADLVNGTTSAKDQQLKLTEYAQQEKDARERINELLQKQKEKEEDLAKQEQARREAEHPKETAARNAAQKALDDDKLDPNKDLAPLEEEARASRRAALQAEINRNNEIINGKVPAGGRKGQDDNDELARNLPADDDGPNSTPPSDRDTAGNRINDAAESLDTTSGTTDEAAGSLADSAGKSSDSASALQDQAGALQQQAGALQTAFGTVKTAQDQYHDAILTGLQGQGDNINGLLQAIHAQNGTIASQASAIQQLQLQVGNLADSGDE